MTELERMTAHLMRFVRVGSRQYAVAQALWYAKVDPWELRDLPARLDVAISLWRKERAAAMKQEPAREP